MSRVILVLTGALLALPLIFLGIAGRIGAPLAIPALLMTAVYGWIWLRFRPTCFVLHPDALEVIWPLKRERVPLAAVSDIQLIDRRELRRRIGFGLRVGAGGLWGGFGWLWTTRRGIVRMYVWRLDQFVWIECRTARPWLITPERSDTFVSILRATLHNRFAGMRNRKNPAGEPAC
jgi:hypothetical protein